MPQQGRALMMWLLSMGYEELPSSKKSRSSYPFWTKWASGSVEKSVLVYQPTGHPKKALIDGEIWPPIFTHESVNSAKHLCPKATDVFVCTYPKCGTTWIQHICSQLMFNDYGPNVGRELCYSSPMIERMGADYVNQLKHPRLMKTHFFWDNCPKSSSAKYIFAVRNPKDCLVSYFFHNRNFKIYNWEDGEFDVLFELFCNGKLAFGDYFDHLKSWLPHIHDPNVLFLKYEDMVSDLEGSVYKIGEFLGGCAKEMVNEPGLLKHVASESSVEAMRENQERWFPETLLNQATFVRKGRIRDWKNYFSKEQSYQFDQLFKRRLAGTEASEWWENEMNWDD